MKRATVLFSGGVDSTSTAVLLKSSGLAVRGLFVDFGQASRHMERKSIARLKNLIGMEVDEIQISSPSSYGSGELHPVPKTPA
jgi:7-cyano-7-deazaguanine synthase